MRKALLIVAAAVGAVGGLLAWWRRNPRVGSAWVNRVVDPWLIRQGMIEGSRGEIGLLEHVGRKSGIVRATPVHPVPTADGFRFIVPLGVESQWAHNVIAAGHCRLQAGDYVYQLDEPRMVAPSEVDGLPRMAAQFMGWLGFRYLLLRRFAEEPGTLARATATAAPETMAVPAT